MDSIRKDSVMRARYEAAKGSEGNRGTDTRRAGLFFNATPLVLAPGNSAQFTTAVAAATSVATIASGMCIRRASGNFIFKLCGLGVTVANGTTLTWTLTTFVLASSASTFAIGGVSQGQSAVDQIVVLGANASTVTVITQGNATPTNVWVSVAKPYLTGELTDIVNYEMRTFYGGFQSGAASSSLTPSSTAMGWTLTCTISAGTLAFATGASAANPGGAMFVEEVP